MTESLNATFFALRPRDRAVLLPATALIVVLVAVLFAAWVALNWGALANMFSVFPTLMLGKPDETAALGMVAGIFALVGSALLFMIPLYIAIATYEAACLRWLIRGEAPGLFGLTLDNDTWRVYGVYWCWFALQFAINMGVSMLTMPFVFMAMGQIGANPTPEEMWQWQLQTQLPLALLQYIPMIFFGVRFAPAAATSIARRRFSFAEAWSVTKGRFWPLLGSFALVWGLWALIGLAASAPLVWRMWPYFAAMFSTPSDEAMSAYFSAFLTPDSWLWIGFGYAVGVAGGMVVAVLCYGINARAALVALEEGKIKAAA